MNLFLNFLFYFHSILTFLYVLVWRFLFLIIAFNYYLPLNSQITLLEPRLIKLMGICFWKVPSEKAQGLQEEICDTTGGSLQSQVAQCGGHGSSTRLKNNVDIKKTRQAVARDLSNNLLGDCLNPLQEYQYLALPSTLFNCLLNTHHGPSQFWGLETFRWVRHSPSFKDN